MRAITGAGRLAAIAAVALMVFASSDAQASGTCPNRYVVWVDYGGCPTGKIGPWGVDYVFSGEPAGSLLGKYCYAHYLDAGEASDAALEELANKVKSDVQPICNGFAHTPDVEVFGADADLAAEQSDGFEQWLVDAHGMNKVGIGSTGAKPGVIHAMVDNGGLHAKRGLHITRFVAMGSIQGPTIDPESATPPWQELSAKGLSLDGGQSGNSVTMLQAKHEVILLAAKKCIDCNIVLTSNASMRPGLMTWIEYEMYRDFGTYVTGLPTPYKAFEKKLKKIRWVAIVLPNGNLAGPHAHDGVHFPAVLAQEWFGPEQRVFIPVGGLQVDDRVSKKSARHADVPLAAFNLFGWKEHPLSSGNSWASSVVSGLLLAGAYYAPSADLYELRETAYDTGVDTYEYVDFTPAGDAGKSKVRRIHVGKFLKVLAGKGGTYGGYAAGTMWSWQVSKAAVELAYALSPLAAIVDINTYKWVYESGWYLVRWATGATSSGSVGMWIVDGSTPSVVSSPNQHNTPSGASCGTCLATIDQNANVTSLSIKNTGIRPMELSRLQLSMRGGGVYHYDLADVHVAAGARAMVYVSGVHVSGETLDATVEVKVLSAGGNVLNTETIAHRDLY